MQFHSYARTFWEGSSHLEESFPTVLLLRVSLKSKATNDVRKGEQKDGRDGQKEGRVQETHFAGPEHF